MVLCSNKVVGHIAHKRRCIVGYGHVALENRPEFVVAAVIDIRVFLVLAHARAVEVDPANNPLVRE